MNETNTPRQQIVEQLKNANNVLVTVGKNPSVDELSAAIGLTLMLNKLNKHATAIYSGATPPAITFLDPQKTLENTVDSLRDFIIALDKEKADRLRYRVEDDVVRIFITPYRTKISEEDLKFTHGDFNVELVLALGVEKQDDLDEAIAAHGKILHDATVATLSAGSKKSTLGSIDWQDSSASSLCEMIVSMSESLKGDESVLDEQIATSYLTGIVSATNPFSNDHTSPKVMTMAAQLMAVGANQQLIASELEESAEISPQVDSNENTTSESENNTDQIPDDQEEDKDESSTNKKDEKDLGEMTIDHGNPSKVKEENNTEQPQEGASQQSLPAIKSATIEEHDRAIKQEAGEQALDAALEKLGEVQPSTTNSQPNLEQELAQAAREVAEDQPVQAPKVQVTEEPTMGGTFSATTQEAHEDSLKEQQSPLNKVIMSHDDIQSTETNEDQLVSTKGRDLAPISREASPSNSELPEVNASPEPTNGQTLADIEADVRNKNTAQQNTALPPLPDFSTLPPLPPNVSEVSSQPSLVSQEQPSSAPIPPPATTDPTQFRIPGSQ